jgi:hypothetical protein
MCQRICKTDASAFRNEGFRSFGACRHQENSLHCKVSCLLYACRWTAEYITSHDFNDSLSGECLADVRPHWDDGDIMEEWAKYGQSQLGGSYCIAIQA